MWGISGTPPVDLPSRIGATKDQLIDFAAGCHQCRIESVVNGQWQLSVIDGQNCKELMLYDDFPGGHGW